MDKELLRENVDEKYKWDLTKFCPDDQTWYQRLEECNKYIELLSQYKGKLHDKKLLREFLDLSNEADEKLESLYMYSGNRMAEDLSNSNYRMMENKIEFFATKLNGEMSFVAPELLSYDKAYLQELQNDPNFQNENFMFFKLLRQKDHVLSAQEEQILSKVGSFSDDFSDIMQTFMAVDLKCEDAVDSKGNKHRVDDKTIVSLMQNPDRELRKNARLSMDKALRGINTTMAINYVASLKKDAFFAQTSKYENTLQAKLFGDNMTANVYDCLLENAHQHLDIVERYHKAKAKKLGYEELFQWDRLCSMTEEIDEKFDFEKTCDILREALLPLGQDYVASFNQALKERWFDVYPTKGKRGGAYENAVYGKTPVIMLNHTDDFDCVSTVAHEFGHAMHSVISDKNQPRQKSQYTIFCAEIASTTNEVLLNEYFLQKTDKSKIKERLFYLDDFLKTFQGTFFRQAMFAEFERFAHDLVDNDKPISHEILNNEYGRLNDEYLPGMHNLEDQAYSWIMIPHFYNKFYVWQYATGIVCAINFASSILNNEPNALENYYKFLSAGGSDFSLNILKNSGIDLTTNAPYEKAFAFVETRLKELEEIVNHEQFAEKLDNFSK